MSAETGSIAPKPREEDLAALREAASGIGAQHLADGTWFSRLVTRHVKKHAAGLEPGHWQRVYPHLDTEQCAERVIDVAAAKATIAGAIASIGASSGEILAIFSEGYAAPIGIPASLGAILLELLYTTVVQVDLTCDLASIYGVPFDVDDVGELSTLFTVAKRKDPAEPDDSDGSTKQGIMQRLASVEGGEVASKIGHKLIEEAVVKNVVPLVGLVVSAPWNYISTRRLGKATQKYIRYRRAIELTMDQLRRAGLPDPVLLTEGAWLLATIDGVASHEEMLAIAILADEIPPYRRVAIEKRLAEDDEDEWFARLAKVPEESRDRLLDALYLFAALDRRLVPAERRFLRRAARALGRAVNFGRVNELCGHLARGEVLTDLGAGSVPSAAPSAAH